MKLPKKISELPSVSTIKNVDLFAIVQDGVTSNVTFAILESVISASTASADTYVTGGVYNSGTTSIDFTGNMGFPPFSVGVSDIGGIFTGNTSATCISDIYVSNIHPCSPLNIIPNNDGNLFIGSGFTFDLTGTTDQRLGINVSTPLANIHIKGLTPPLVDNLFLLEDSLGNIVLGANDEGALAIGVDPHDIAMSGKSSLFIKGESNVSTGNFDDENLSLRVVNSSNNNLLVVKNGGPAWNPNIGRVGVNAQFGSQVFLPDHTVFYVKGDDAGPTADGNVMSIADGSTNTIIQVQNDSSIILCRSLPYGKVRIGGDNPAAKLHINLPTSWQDDYGETMAMRIDGLKDIAPFTGLTPNIFTVDNFGNTNIIKRTTTENFTMTSGGTNNYILTSDASGNASWQEPNDLFIKRTLIKSEILALTGTPIELISAPGPGKIILPHQIHVLYKFSGTGYTADGGFNSMNIGQSGFTWMTIFNSNFANLEDWLITDSTVGGSAAAMYNQPLNVTTSGGGLTDPNGLANGTIQIDVHYDIMDST